MDMVVLELGHCISDCNEVHCSLAFGVEYLNLIEHIVQEQEKVLLPLKLVSPGGRWIAECGVFRLFLGRRCQQVLESLLIYKIIDVQ